MNLLQYRPDCASQTPLPVMRAVRTASIVLATSFASVTAYAAESRSIDVAIIESGDAKVASEMLIVERGGTRVPGVDAKRTVASLDLRNGATLIFLEIDGYVDIVERTATRMPFVAEEMLTRWKATPLEIFKALAPDQPAPSALLADHERRDADGAGSAVRHLAPPPSATLSLDDPGLEPYVCDVYFELDHWMDDWNAAFDGVTAYSAATYIHQFPAFTFYPGAPVYYGTGTNRETYLGACNGSHGHQAMLYVDRWVVTNVTVNPYPQPPTVTWGWGNVFDVTLQDGEKYTYYSGHPHARFRGRVEGIGGMAVPHQGVAAAWTPSFPIGIGFAN